MYLYAVGLFISLNEVEMGGEVSQQEPKWISELFLPSSRKNLKVEKKIQLPWSFKLASVPSDILQYPNKATFWMPVPPSFWIMQLRRSVGVDVKFSGFQ